MEIISTPNLNGRSAAKRGNGKLMKKEKIEKLKAEEVVVNSMKCHGRDSEKTALFEWLLGPNSDKIVDKLKVNAVQVFKKVCFNPSSYEITD